MVLSANVLEQLTRDGEASHFVEMIYSTNLNQVGTCCKNEFIEISKDGFYKFHFLDDNLAVFSIHSNVSSLCILLLFSIPIIFVFLHRSKYILLHVGK